MRRCIGGGFSIVQYGVLGKRMDKPRYRYFSNLGWMCVNPFTCYRAPEQQTAPKAGKWETRIIVAMILTGVAIAISTAIWPECLAYAHCSR